MQKPIILGVVGLALVSACAATPSGADPEAITLPILPSCESFAMVRCERMAACTEGVLVAQQFGSRAACEEHLTDACMLRALAPGAAVSPESVDACTAAMSAASCRSFFEVPAACRPMPGSLVGGDACSFGEQCDSLRCRRVRGANCGTCVASRTACSPATCPAPAQCVLGHCAIPIGDGPPPAVTGPVHGLTPEAVPALVAWIDPVEPGPARIAGPGELCGLSRPGVVCARAGRCVRATGARNGVCVAAAPDGGRCTADPSRGPGCMAPARCVYAPGASSGTCERPAAALCGE